MSLYKYTTWDMAEDYIKDGRPHENAADDYCSLSMQMEMIPKTTRLSGVDSSFISSSLCLFTQLL